MKKYIIAILILLSAGQLIPMRSIAQRKVCPMPQNGLWELITKDSDPHFVVVRCYDSALALIYEGRLTVMPDLRKKGVCQSLNRILESALAVQRRSARH